MPVSDERPATPSKYLFPDQIGILIGVHTNTVNRWLKEGVRFSDGNRRRPEAIRTPGGWRVREDRLWNWLDAVKADRASEPSDAPEAPRSARGERMKQMEAQFAAVGL